MAEQKVFTGVFACGLTYEVHQASAFTDRTEVAVMVNGEVVCIIAADKRRTGMVDVRVTKQQKVLAPLPIVQAPPVEVPSLDDIATVRK